MPDYLNHEVRMQQQQNKTLAVNFILAINIIVFILWNVRINPYFDLQFMYNNFLVSWTALNEGRYWTLLTSVFSHNALMHLFLNLFVLKSFGSIIEQILGTYRFVTFYLIAGVFSSFCHATVSAFLLGEPSLPALGASGAISGVVLIFCFLFPKDKILLLGIIPIPAFIGGILFIGLDVWGLAAQAGGGGLPIGHGAHLGGAFVGIIYYLLFLRKKISAKRNLNL